MRIALAIAWPVALVVWLYERTADIGFNILDEALVASYSRRILDGQLPHADFISPRPVGSALLHIPDLVIPLPLYLASRLDGIGSVVVFTLLISWFLFRAPPWLWSVLQAAGTAAAALVNLHTFGETAWYTFDGLILTAGALVLADAGLRRERRGLLLAAALTAGLAVTTKQSFAPAPVIVLGWVAISWRGAARARLLAASVALAALPALLYALVVATGGGWSDMVAQFGGGRVVWGRSLLEVAGVIGGPAYGRPPFHGHFPWEVALAAALLLVVRRRRGPWWGELALALATIGLTLRLVFHQDLVYEGSWSLEVMWVFLLVLLVRIPFEQRADFRWLALATIAWMTMLSWGYDVPALVAGSMALAVGAWALEGVRMGAASARSAATAGSPGHGHAGFALALAAGIALFAFTAVREVQARDADPYFDRPASQLTATVGDVDHDFSGIRTSPAVADYLHGLQRCLRRYPAWQAAIVPDNPAIYGAMGLHNPFPIDWFWANDYHGQRDRLIQAARDLESRGHYLVLFQTVSGLDLQRLTRLPPATRRSAPVILAPIYDPRLGRALIATLRGRHVVCGSFLGIYKPG